MICSLLEVSAFNGYHHRLFLLSDELSIAWRFVADERASVYGLTDDPSQSCIHIIGTALPTPLSFILPDLSTFLQRHGSHRLGYVIGGTLLTRLGTYDSVILYISYYIGTYFSNACI